MGMMIPFSAGSFSRFYGLNPWKIFPFQIYPIPGPMSKINKKLAGTAASRAGVKKQSRIFLSSGVQYSKQIGMLE